MSENIDEQIIKELMKKPLSYNDFALEFAMDSKQVKKKYETLRKQGYAIDREMREGDVYYFFNPDINKKDSLYVPVEQIDNEFSIGAISDTHLGDKACRLDALAQYYDEIESRGIKYVEHAGDLVAGIKVYSGQMNDLICWTLDDQLAYVTKYYPKKKGVITEFVSGNHDYSFTKEVGVDFGTLVESKRKDMKYLGMTNARLNLGGIKIDLYHLEKNPAYALSYPGQRLIEKMSDPPNVLLLGHRHTAIYTMYQNAHILESGTFQGETNFTKKKGLLGFICGWIISIKQKEGKITGFEPELLMFK